MRGASFREQLHATAAGREIADTDWTGTGVGEIEDWPPALIALLSALLACPSPMFLAWGPDLLSFYNDAYRPILGQRAGGATGRPFRELWHDIWADIEPLVARTLAGESIEMVDTRLDIRRAGLPDESWWTFTYSPVRDDHGAVAGLLCITRETTEQVRAGQVRRLAAEQLQAALAKGDAIGSWDWDVRNNRLTTDERFALIYNVDPDRAAQGTVLDAFLACIHPDDLPLVKSQIEATVRFGDSYCTEYRILGADGQVQWVSAQGRAVLDANGTCVRFPGVSFDITINKRMKVPA